MRFLYLVKVGSNRATAFRKPEEVTLFDQQKAAETGYKWLNEEEAIEVNLMVPNSSNHYGIISKERTWQVPVKIEDNAIWCHWLMKWYAVREYRVKGKIPSKQVMREMEVTFRLNSGIPINHDISFNW